MIAMDGLLTLLRSASEFLQNPRVEVSVTPGDQVQELRAEVAALSAQIEHMEAEVRRAQFQYARECEISMRLMDVLREHGIRYKR